MSVAIQRNTAHKTRLVQASRISISTPQNIQDNALGADVDHMVLPSNGVAFKHLAPLHKVR